MFVSRSSLWTDFNGEDMDKTRVYLERSKSSPITLTIAREDDLSPHDPLFEIIPYATGRLKALSIQTTPENFSDITTRLSRPAPLLEYLSIDCGYEFKRWDNSVLTTPLFNGNLSSLYHLRLQFVCTLLPWRSMVNRTSFTLGSTLLEISIGHLLDFFEGAPHLKNVELCSATPTTGAQDGRLVLLACLERMTIHQGKPCSLLLDHLLIPVGAELAIRVDSFSSRPEVLLPRSLDNLRNISNLTKINLDLYELSPDIRITGPNGQVSVSWVSSQINPTSLALEYLARIDTSKTKCLEINRGNPSSRDPPYLALLPMINLRTLKLSQCQSLRLFIGALHPDRSTPGPVVCPKLEELILVLHNNGGLFDIKDLIDMATARALEGAKLGTVRIIGGDDKFDPGDALELMKHVLCVECGPGWA